MVFPVYEFRPLPDYFGAFDQPVRRYADGKWIEDDGEYDIAFIGGPFCLYFSAPYQRNIVCSWLSTHWSGSVYEHPRANPWHYALRDGTTEWGGDWGSRNHPNSLAGDAGMSKVCSERRAASGRLIKFEADDPTIRSGLLRERDTKTAFKWPVGMTCMYCAAAAPVGLQCEAA